MNKTLLIALPFIAALSVAPAMAGSLGGTVSEPEVRAPVVVVAPPVGGLGAGAVIGGVAAVALLAVLLSDSSTATTTGE